MASKGYKFKIATLIKLLYDSKEIIAIKMKQHAIWLLVILTNQLNIFWSRGGEGKNDNRRTGQEKKSAMERDESQMCTQEAVKQFAASGKWIQR